MGLKKDHRVFMTGNSLILTHPPLHLTRPSAEVHRWVKIRLFPVMKT